MGFIVVQNRFQCLKNGTQFISDTQKFICQKHNLKNSDEPQNCWINQHLTKEQLHIVN